MIIIPNNLRRNASLLIEEDMLKFGPVWSSAKLTILLSQRSLTLLVQVVFFIYFWVSQLNGRFYSVNVVIFVKHRRQVEFYLWSLRESTPLPAIGGWGQIVMFLTPLTGTILGRHFEEEAGDCRRETEVGGEWPRHGFRNGAHKAGGRTTKVSTSW